MGLGSSQSFSSGLERQPCQFWFRELRLTSCALSPEISDFGLRFWHCSLLGLSYWLDFVLLCFDAEKPLGLIFITLKKCEILNVKIPQGGCEFQEKGLPPRAGDSARNLP